MTLVELSICLSNLFLVVFHNEVPLREESWLLNKVRLHYVVGITRYNDSLVNRFDFVYLTQHFVIDLLIPFAVPVCTVLKKLGELYK
jgi:hypothetical protein